MRYYDYSHSMLLRNSNESLANDNDSYIRFLHAATMSTHYDIYIDDKLIAPGIMYREFTDYIKLPPGTHNIKIYPANSKTRAVINSNINIQPYTITTFTAYSENRNQSLQPIPETPLPSPTKNKAKIRIAQFIENMSPVDVYLSDGTLLYKNIRFKDLTNYIELPPNTYIMDIKLADTDLSMLFVPNMNLKGDNYYTLYLIGQITDFHDPQMLIPLDGITYIGL